MFHYRTNLRWMGALAITLSIAWSAGAASAAEGPVGQWQLSMETPRGLSDATLTISKNDDGSLKGVWAGRRGEAELSDVKFEEGKLTFSRKINAQGQEFEMRYEGKIDGDWLTGNFVTDFGDFPASGKRAGAAGGPGGLKGLVGEWDILSVSALGDLERKLVINADKSGTYETPDEKYPISDLTIEGDKLSFKVTVSAQGQDLALTFNGSVDGMKLDGQFTSEFGEGKVTGTKIIKLSPALKAAVGTWNVTSESGLGTLERKIVINADLTGKYVTDEDEFEITDLKIEGNKISYKVTINVDGTALPLEFTGTIDGENIAGAYTSEGGDAEIKGSKAK